MVIAIPSLFNGWGMARTSREGDRVETAVRAAGSVTLRNGACPIPAPSDRQALPSNEHFDSSDQTALTVDRETANNDDPSLTGSYAVLLLHPWVCALLGPRVHPA